MGPGLSRSPDSDTAPDTKASSAIGVVVASRSGSASSRLDGDIFTGCDTVHARHAGTQGWRDMHKTITTRHVKSDRHTHKNTPTQWQDDCEVTETAGEAAGEAVGERDTPARLAAASSASPSSRAVHQAAR